MRVLLYACLFLLHIPLVYAQGYHEGGKTRHRFAQLELGVEQCYLPGIGSSSTFRNSEGVLSRYTLADEQETRIIIGGTHFWGHADFYLGVPVVSWNKQNFKTGVETGAKFYPWRITHNKLRPYFGFSFNPSHFQQGDGVNQRKTLVPLQAGITFNRNDSLLELGIAYNYNNDLTYYINKTEAVNINVHPVWITLGYKVLLETTLGAEKNWLKGITQRETDSLARNRKLNNFSIALGPSSTRFLNKSEHNTNTRPYLHHPEIEKFFWDLGIGYYLHKPDVHFNLAFREYNSSLYAYGTRQEISRSSLSLEAFKFLFDYHGFVPFIGPLLSLEELSITETSNDALTASGGINGLRMGLIVGWDIRPTRMQTWLLRTNIRYFPNMTVPMSSGYRYSLDQLELNFIQLVLYPERFFLKKKS